MNLNLSHVDGQCEVTLVLTGRYLKLCDNSLIPTVFPGLFKTRLQINLLQRHEAGDITMVLTSLYGRYSNLFDNSLIPI